MNNYQITAWCSGFIRNQVQEGDANGEELGSVPAMSQAEVDEVYAAAKAALPI